MEKKHQLAIEFRYEGFSYKEIEAKLEGALTEGTLRVYFSVDGKLYMPYLEYAAKQNQAKEEMGKAKLKGAVDRAIQTLLDALDWEEKRVKRDIKQLRIPDYTRMIEISEKILDRAGVTVVRRAEIETKATEGRLTRDQLIAEIQRLGFDPRSGHRTTMVGKETN